MARFRIGLVACLLVPIFSHADARDGAWSKIAQYFSVPAEYVGKFGDYRSPLVFDDGSQVKDA
jgi:hypothetical protein